MGLSACSLDEVLLEGETGDGSVSFKVVAGNATRTSATTTNNIKSFSVWAWNDSNEFMDCVTAIKGDNGTFTTSPLYFWPNGTVDFYALSPTAMGYAVDTGVEYAYLGGEITIDENDEGGEHWSYTGNVARATIAEDNISIDAYIPGSAEDQIDLCYAVAKEYDSTCGSVPMNFRHALSQIVFKAKDANEDFTVDVAGVSVCSVYKQGTYVLKGVPSTTDHLDEGDSTSPVSSSQGEWSTESHKARYAAGVTAQTLPTSGETVTLTSEGGALMLLPQTVEAWDPDSDPTDKELGAYIRILCHVEEHGSVLWPTDAEEENGAITVGEDGKDYAEIAVPVDIEWEEGYRYTYTIIFGNGLGYYLPDDPNADLDGTPVLKIITFEVSVDEFQNADEVNVSTNTDYTLVSFDELRNNYATGKKITDNIAIEGIVVSNREQGNAGCPVQTSNETIDFSPAAKTIYFQSEDGKYGIAIFAETEDDNVFDQFDMASIMLTGATLTAKGGGGSCPVRYELTGFKSSMVFDREAGSAPAAKERTIGTLTDDDVYTYVKLKTVEFPIRKGGLTPVDGLFDEADGAQRITKYPLLVRDVNGDALYMFTNDLCLYHRDGTCLPNGKGDICGVIVHEHFSRFDWASGLEHTDGFSAYDDVTIEDYSESVGNIGRYQIRHQTKGDVWDEMEEEFEDGFTKMICEVRYLSLYTNLKWKNSTASASRSTGSTYWTDKNDVTANGYLTHTYYEKYTNSSSLSYWNSNRNFYDVVTTEYLGPCGTAKGVLYPNEIGNKNGIGVIVDDDHSNMYAGTGRFAVNKETGRKEMACQYSEESAYAGYGDAGWSESASSSSTKIPNCNVDGNGAGVAHAHKTLYSGFGHDYWWVNGQPYGYLLYFQTTGISSSVVSMQIHMRGIETTGYTPRYWHAEWAWFEDGVLDPSADYVDLDSLTWAELFQFTVPDASSWDHPHVWQLPACKSMDFPVTTDILGKANVYVRIRPMNDLCCNANGGDYDTAHIEDSGNTSHGVSLEYIAVRCNK